MQSIGRLVNSFTNLFKSYTTVT